MNETSKTHERLGNIFTILAWKIDEATGKSREQTREQY
jgi:hypothetical protein